MALMITYRPRPGMYVLKAIVVFHLYNPTHLPSILLPNVRQNRCGFLRPFLLPKCGTKPVPLSLGSLGRPHL
jgi:hypothetical protein